ncbi:MAG: transcriptional repressor [Campylobacteraceae bacterium]|nr:transcriptional repressor [Campylobacteraceae bacterium]
MYSHSNLLKEYSLKVTPQRVAIVDELSKHGHMNIDALYKVLLVKFPSISLATIYKNINAMIEKVFVSEVKIADKKSVYELIKEEHSHIVCSSCGKIEDMSLDLSALIAEVSKNTRYDIKDTALCFSGLCQECKNK